MFAVTSLSSNRADTITGYVSGMTASDVSRLRDNPDVIGVVPVASVPSSLVTPAQCLDLVTRAERAGLVWHLSPEVGFGDGERVSLRVYGRGPDGAPRGTLVDVTWSDGATLKGHGLQTLKAARESLEEAVARKDVA